jgi:hypothetical protein
MDEDINYEDIPTPHLVDLSEIQGALGTVYLEKNWIRIECINSADVYLIFPLNEKDKNWLTYSYCR